MSVTANDLVLVGCQYHAEDDSSQQGGSIDKGKLLSFSNQDIQSPDEIEAIASVAITATITIYGKSAVGASISETLTFSSEAGPKTTALEFERVTKVVVASGSIPASATVTIRRESDDAEILTLYGSSVSPSGTEVSEVRKMFLGATIPATGSNTYYEKAYYLNAHDTDTLGLSEVSEFADPAGRFTFAIEATADGSSVIANRLTAPSGLTFDNAAKSFGNLNAGEAIPVWVRLVLPSTESPQKTSFTKRLSGSVT